MIFGKYCILCEKFYKKEDCEYYYRTVCVCKGCTEEFMSNKVARILDVRKPLSMVIPCAYYNDKIRNALHQYKFENDRAYKNILAYLAERRLEKWQQLYDFDAVVVVPISKTRMRERGYNQSSFIADEISRIFNVPIHDEYLIKVKNVQKQSKLKNVERAINIRDAYESGADLNGKNIILVDDIYTTGATMSEAARTLKNAGAEVIVGVVFAAVLRKKHNENIFW